MKKYLILLAIVFSIVGFFLIFKTRESNDQIIKIGFIGPLTGDVAGVGIPSRAATEYAIEQINARRGIRGKKIVLIAEDSRCDSKTAANAGKKLIDIDHVAAIIGGLCSSETLAVAPLAEASKTVLLSYASSDPSLTKSGDYIFRIYPSDAYQGDFAARYAYEKLGKRVAIIYTDSAATKSIQEIFSQIFRSLGGDILASESILQGTKDLRTIVTKVKSVHPDFIYAPTYTGEAITLLQELKRQDISVPVLANDGWEDKIIFESAQDAAEGVRFTSGATPEVPQTFPQELQKLTGIENPPTIPALQAYDAIQVIAQAIERSGTRSNAIKNALYSISYQGFSNSAISFDQNGDLAHAEYVVKKVRNGVIEIEKD